MSTLLQENLFDTKNLTEVIELLNRCDEFTTPKGTVQNGPKLASWLETMQHAVQRDELSQISGTSMLRKFTRTFGLRQHIAYLIYIGRTS